MTKPTKLAEERGMVLKNIGDGSIYFLSDTSFFGRPLFFIP
jgi:hypothetical protein